MRISEHITNTIESWVIAWGDRLRGWMASWVMKGVEATFDFFEPDIRAEVKPSLQRLRDIPELPEDIKAILDKAMAEPKAIQFAVLLPYLIAVMVGFAMGSMQPAMRMGGYGIDLVMKSARLDPASVITAWRRDPVAYEKFFEDLKSLGWSDERIEAMKFITLFIPTADEQTHWLAREVYEPEMVSRYGLDDELPNYEETDFSKVGVSPEQMSNKWKAHWEHASYMQVREMLRRGVLSLDRGMPSPPTTQAGWETRDAEGSKAMFDWYRLVEIPPFWRERLTEMVFEVPTRVDVRRFWDMRTIDEERLRSIYHAQGYHGKDLDDYVLWTKVYVAFPDLIARFKNGWITEDDVRSELTALGMSPERLEEMWQTKFKTAQPERVMAEKTATATEIMKAVKKGYITWGEGIERLGRMGYSSEEADFKITVYVGVSEGSPETYVEFVDWTERYRLAQGLDAHIPSAELLEAAKAYKADPSTDNAYRYRQLLIAYEEGKKRLPSS